MPRPPDAVCEEASGSRQPRGGAGRRAAVANSQTGSTEAAGIASRKRQEPTPASATATPVAPGALKEVQKVATIGHQQAGYPPAHMQVGRVLPLQMEGHSGEVFLMQMLAAMDQHMQQLRETQQGLVATVELACRRALERQFGRLVLVGSAALRVETPGSDVDVVCFTRREGDAQSAGLPAAVLRRVYTSLRELIQQYSDYPTQFSMELIDDARVPILRVLWGPPEHAVAVDVSVDQNRPLDHVRWFQKVGAAPRPTEPPPIVAPLVTLTLRCVKWWLRQRQIPRTKEGAMPTLAWLLMAVHVCSLPETHDQAIGSGQRPMAALLASLAAFFRQYNSLERLDGVLQFGADGSSSEFRRNENTAHSSASPWSELTVLDPTREGQERLNLVPRLPPATQLLLSYELSRAARYLDSVPKGSEATPGESRRILEEVFRPLPEGTNALPSFLQSQPVAALLLCNEAAEGGKSPTLRNADSCDSIQVGVIEGVIPRPGWSAPFLLRSDERSEIVVKFFDIEEGTGRCSQGRTNSVRLCPSNFICCVNLEKDGRVSRLDAESLDRYMTMRRFVADVYARREKLRLRSELAAAAKVRELCSESTTSTDCSPAGLSEVTNVPSPVRSPTKSVRSMQI